MIHITLLSSNINDKFSSWTDLLQIISLCQRFTMSCKQPCENNTGYRTPDNIDKTEIIWVKEVQWAFSENTDNLQKNKKASNRIKSLASFTNNEGILHIGGR